MSPTSGAIRDGSIRNRAGPCHPCGAPHQAHPPVTRHALVPVNQHAPWMRMSVASRRPDDAISVLSRARHEEQKHDVGIHPVIADKQRLVVFAAWTCGKPHNMNGRPKAAMGYMLRKRFFEIPHTASRIYSLPRSTRP